MNKTLKLFFTLRKCGSSSASENSASSSSQAGGTVVLTVLGVLLAGLLGYVGYWIAPLSGLFGGISRILSALGVLAGFMLIFLSFRKLVVSMYMSSDIDVLLTMPLSPMQIVINRILDVLLSDYLVSALIFLPFTIGYSIRIFDLQFLLFSLLMFLAIPLFIVCAVAVIVILIMRIFKIFRSKEVLALLGLIIALILFVLYSLASNSTEKSNFEQVVTQITNLFDKLQYVVPIVPFLCRFIAGDGVLYLLIALGILAVSFILFRIVSATCYLDGAMNMINSADTGKPLTREKLERLCRKRTPRQAIRAKDFAITTRTPSFLMNDYILLWAWPILALLMFFFSGSFGVVSEEPLNELERFYANLMILNLIVPIAHSILQLISQIASRAFSREGADFLCLKQFPVSSREQIRAKRGLALRVFGLGTVVYPIIITAILAIFGSYSWFSVLYVALLCVPLTYFDVNMGIFFDLRRPNINWSNEAEVGKGNTPFTVYSLILAVIQLVLGFFGMMVGPLMITVFPNLDPTVTTFLYSGLLVVLYTAAAIISDKMMYKTGIRQLKRMTA